MFNDNVHPTEPRRAKGDEKSRGGQWLNPLEWLVIAAAQLAGAHAIQQRATTEKTAFKAEKIRHLVEGGIVKPEKPSIAKQRAAKWGFVNR